MKVAFYFVETYMINATSNYKIDSVHINAMGSLTPSISCQSLLVRQ